MGRIKEIIKSWQEKGVPIFFIRDNEKPSVTLTLVVLSATIILVGLIGKASGVLGGIDMQSALYWHGMSLATYMGRKITGDGKKIEISENKTENK